MSGAPVTRRATLLWPAIAVALLVGVLALPELGPKVDQDAPVTAAHGRIVSIDRTSQPSADNPGVLPDTKVLMLDGPQAGQVIDAYLQGPVLAGSRRRGFGEVPRNGAAMAWRWGDMKL